MSESLLDEVCILQGTESRSSLSFGNTLPIVSLPWGMHHWSLQTHTGRWLFDPNEPKVQGMRLTHQPNPWIGDYAALCVMPQTGPVTLDPLARASSYRIQESIFRPDECSVYLTRYRCHMRLTPTFHGGVIRCEFDNETLPRMIVEAVPLDSPGTMEASQTGSHVVQGRINNHSGGVPDRFAMYFIADFDKPIERFVQTDHTFYVEFSQGTRRVELRLAGSFIGYEQARITLEKELIGRSWEGIRALARTAWLEHLERFEIDGCTAHQRKTFYSCLYRTLLFPRGFSEIDAHGQEVHYSPYDGGVHPGPMYTDTGFGDSHRTVFPWLNWLFPQVASRMIQALLNGYREGGWLAEWASPGYRACVNGTHSNVVLADAIIKEIPGFDRELALQAMIKNATHEGAADRRYGRQGVAIMDQLGYLPSDAGFCHPASATLDYAYNDWCISQVAGVLGQEEIFQTFLERSKRWRNVFDPGVGFIRGRLTDGSWVQPFNPVAWGGPYVKGSAWQCTWAVPHDLAGLIQFMGGSDGLVQKIDTLLDTPPVFDTGSYPSEVHEMTEMSRVDFGQYVHCNPYMHHVLWLYALAGAPEKCHRNVHRVLNELYSFSSRGFAGDENNGGVSAWFLLASFGIYPFCPGSPSYTLGLPWLPRIVIRKPDGSDLMINTDRRLLGSPGTRVVRRIDGQLYRLPTIAHEVLENCARIDVVPA